MIIFLIILLGLVLGSFFNALAYRIVRGESVVKGRSKCPNCNHQLNAKDLIPIFSWLWLRGQCRYCHQNISWHYPAAEIISAVFFVWLYLVFGLTMQFFYTAFATCFLIPIFITDARDYIIPDSLSISGIIIIFGVQLWRGFDFANLGLAALIGGGFFLLQYLISRGKWIGSGDIRLGILMGVALGFPIVIVALILAYVGGALIALVLLVFNRKQLASQLPFGAFLTVATFTSFLYGTQLITWYFSLMR